MSFTGNVHNTATGTISGANNGLYFGTGNHDTRVANEGTISSDSRAVNIDGNGVTFNNFGKVLGTGDQRNGTVYADATADKYEVNNFRQGVIDAGAGNDGAGIALQTGEVVGDTVTASVFNAGTVQGRGQAAANVGQAGDGLRIFPGVEGGTTFQGNIVNDGTFASESTQGPTAGVRIANGVGFDGAVVNNSGATISGANNGLYFGTGDHDAEVLNFGTISSDSRAVNIDGTGVNVNNFGSILGTGDQRNGTVYADGTADKYEVNNFKGGVIDAGVGNNGAGVALQTGDAAGDVVTAHVFNGGTIQGRGQAAANVGEAGDGLRIFAGDPGGTTFRGDIVNEGSFASESTQGTTAGIRVANGVSFEGNVVNNAAGTISGANNGLYFGTGSHDAVVTNLGTISSDSRALNIDGTGVISNNFGNILGTGDQRIGTIYADGTADKYEVNNFKTGVVDAGVGNDGAGIALQTGDSAGDTVTASVFNLGTVQGRGQATANVGEAGDGLRIFAGDAGGTTFQGNVINDGSFSSESTQGPTAGVRVANGVSFDGAVVNNSDGVISGANNGLYFGTGDHDAEVLNFGTITSDSRAVNIDGNGVEFNNFASVLGTGDQRNGTTYADATADQYEVNNFKGGTIDAGVGNNGAGVSLQTGDVAGDVVTADVFNAGTIQGRGSATADLNTAGDGLRIFTTIEGGVTFKGDIENLGTIAGSADSAEVAGIRIADNVTFAGTITNKGTISGTQNSIDASQAEGGVKVVNEDTLIGDVVLSEGNDTFDARFGTAQGQILAGGGDDVITTGDTDDVINAGAGNDVITTGSGTDMVTTGAGSDILVVQRDDNGVITITDFTNGEDRIDLSEFGLAGGPNPFTDNFNAAGTLNNSEVTIDGLQILLDGFGLQDLDETDFIFEDEVV